MRFPFLLGLGVLACGGTTDGFSPLGAGGALAIAGRDAGAASKPGFVAQGGSGGASTTAGGSQSENGVSGEKSTAGGGQGGDGELGGTSAGTGGAGSAGATAGTGGGVATAGAGGGGTSGAAAGDGGQGGAPPAPDDTGCVERPWTGNQADQSEKVPGLDCSSCTTGAAMGYTAPSFCDGAKACSGGDSVVDLTKLPADVFLLLPPGSAQAASCHPQNCEGADGKPADLPGYVAELYLTLPAGHTVTVETDSDRRVLKRDQALFKCAEASSCISYGSAAPLVIVVKPDAPRGWARIHVDSEGVCQ